MDNQNSTWLLELIERPAFFVRDGIIVQVNQAAGQRLITTGTPVADILADDAAAYAEYTGGCLYLTVTTAHITCGASVSRMSGLDIFLLQEEDPKLQVLELAAQQLRIPLNDVLTVADQLTAEDSKVRSTASHLHKGLNQMHRIICNMADAGWYRLENAARMEDTDLTAFFDELMERLNTLVAASGNTLHYTGPMQIVIGRADRIMLERAVNNLFSNAIKFSPKGSVLDASVCVNGDLLKFSLLDQGSRTDSADPANLFTRYLRAPAIEDSRNGIGLGLPLVVSVAAAHGGTILVDHPGEQGTRVTMTIKLSRSQSTDVRMPVLLPTSDYAGGRDRGLLEFSEVLPVTAYKELTPKN